jgi:hypothetical protein
MKLSNVIRLRKEDHWEMLKEISGELKAISARVSTIRDSLKMAEVSEARSILASELANVEVIKDIVRSHLCVMDSEWKREVAKAEEAIVNRLLKSTLSLEDLI